VLLIFCPIGHHVLKTRNTLSQTNKRQKGQGMSEYLAATALIGVAAIGTLGGMGDVIQSQFTAMTSELAGKDGKEANNKAGIRADEVDGFNEDTGMKNFSDTGAKY